MTTNDPGRRLIRNSTAEFLMFTADGGDASIEARYEDGTVWLTQRLMAELFGVDVRTVSEHLRNVFASGELEEEAVFRNFRIPARDGKTYATKHYNLDAIISVGYRVNSVRATQFRQWATRVLRDFAVRGYVLDRERLENGTFLGEDYFERLLEEIREIRLSERRFYQKVTDVYATAVDYNADAPKARSFAPTAPSERTPARSLHSMTAASSPTRAASRRRPPTDAPSTSSRSTASSRTSSTSATSTASPGASTPQARNPRPTVNRNSQRSAVDRIGVAHLGSSFKAWATGTRATYNVQKWTGTKVLGQSNVNWRVVSTSGTLTAFSPVVGFSVGQ